MLTNEDVNKQTEIQEAAWVIQHWDASENTYVNYPGYSENLMTCAEMTDALNECIKKWPSKGFLGHNVLNAQRREKLVRKGVA